jgi:hypothetical protein
MTTTQRRIALLTGASLATIGLAAVPAYAAPHDTNADGTYAGANTTTDTVTICDLAATPGSPCFFGIIDTAGGPAVVNSTANGLIFQHDAAATVTLTMTNALGSSAEVGAISKGGVAGHAAISGIAIHQSASGSAATINMTNDGHLLIDASATGSGAGAAALASVGVGIEQAGLGATSVQDNLTNNGDLTIAAHAQAVGGTTGGAAAEAVISTGIRQNFSFITGTGDAHLVNNGALNITASATATGIDAAVLADVGHGIVGAALTNNAAGTLAINAIANAHASGGEAVAEAVVGTGISQGFFAITVPAHVAIVNDGNLTIGAAANAGGVVTATGTVAASEAVALAVLDQGIKQHATQIGSGAATVGLTNNGSLTISAIANANASVAAVAEAIVEGGISQVANGSTSAHVALTNGTAGSINILASANAVGGSLAGAMAVLDSGIVQEAHASSGNASVAFDNEGSIDIGAVAHVTGDASAHANVVGGIGLAAGYTTDLQAAALVVPLATAAGASATVAMTNNGSIDIHATGAAHNTGTGFAGAFAVNSNAITEGAFASSGNATVSLTGTGSINVGALANATADSGNAVAIAHVANAIGQTASAANGNALNSFSQSTVAIHATANAHGNANGVATDAALASAVVTRGIGQNAFASATFTAITGGTVPGVSASNVLTNAGSISILANASAIAPKVTVIGSGSTNHATFPVVDADAHVGIGIQQNATATAAAISLSTVGTVVTVGFSGTANASNSLTNSGSITVGAMATATGAFASAIAGVGTGIDQNALAGGTTFGVAGTSDNASNTITNSLGGTINVGAVANANGGQFAHAYATVGAGIDQNAAAVAKSGLASASDTLTNDGTIMVGATAKATGNGTYLFGTPIAGAAVATANVGVGIRQVANANASGIATASGSSSILGLPTTEAL